MISLKSALGILALCLLMLVGANIIGKVEGSLSLVTPKSAEPVFVKGILPVSSPGVMRYRQFSVEFFESTDDSKRVLFFYSANCASCLKADKEIIENQERIPQNIIIYKVSLDEDQLTDQTAIIKRKYFVDYPHTFVIVDSDGNEIRKWNGGSIDELLRSVR